MPYHSRATQNLLPGRISVAGASYFLTWCTQHRASTLTEPAIRTTVRAVITGLEAANDGIVLAATIMPDHVHLLLTLGSRLTVSQVVAKMKAAASRCHSSVHWQLNFFEHRLRNSTEAERYAFYIFMNPYTAKLCALHETWPGWIPLSRVHWEFQDKLQADKFPQAEWLAEAEHFAQAMPAGAE